MIIVKVTHPNQYPANKYYEFKSDIEGLQIGDIVVCDTTQGMQLGTVKNFGDVDNNKATKWIIDIVDTSKHQQRLEVEKKQKELKNRLEKRRKQLEEETVYRILAKEDEEMAALLSEYENLK